MEKFMHSEFNVYNIQPYYVYMTKTCQTPMLNRRNYALCFNENGYGKTTFFDGTVLETSPGDIEFIPINASYHLEIFKPHDSFNIGFSLMEDIDVKPFLFHTKNDQKLCERFKTVLNLWRAQKPDYKERAYSEFYHILATMKRHYFTDYMPKEKYTILKPAIEYIHNNYYHKNIKVDELAKLCQITPEYFRDIFKRIYGSSPLKYINNLQITYAKQLIDSDAYNISEISAMLGFSDISQFSHKFKSVTGVSPTEYLNIIKNF